MKIYATQLSAIQLQELTQPRSANAFMVVKGSQHTLASDTVKLSLVSLKVQDSQHALKSDKVTLETANLPVLDAKHTQTVDEVAFTGKHNGIRHEKVSVVFAYDEPYLRYAAEPNQWFNTIDSYTSAHYDNDLQVVDGVARIQQASSNTNALSVFEITSGVVSDVQTAKGVIKVISSSDTIAPRLAVRYTASTGYMGWFNSGSGIFLYRFGTDGAIDFIKSSAMTNLHTGDLIELNFVSTKLEAVLNGIIIASATVSAIAPGVGLPAIGGYWPEPAAYGFSEARGGTWYIDMDVKDSTHAMKTGEPDYALMVPISDSTHALKSSIVGWTQHREARSERYYTTFHASSNITDPSTQEEITDPANGENIVDLIPWNESPIQEGIWPNHAWIGDTQRQYSEIITLSGDAYSWAVLGVARCVYVSGAVRNAQYSKGTVFASSPSNYALWELGVRQTASTGYRAVVKATGSATLIQQVSALDYDLIGNAFNVSPITTGTEIELRIDGDRITFLIDGSTAAIRTNSQFTDGIPSFGLYNNGIVDDYNKMSFTAWEGGSFYPDMDIKDSHHALKSELVTFGGTSEFDIKGSQHTATSEGASLTVQTLAGNVFSSKHDATTESASLTVQPIDVAVNSSHHVQTSDKGTLWQYHDLPVNESTHRFTSDQVLMTSEGTIVFRDSTHRHTTDLTTLWQEHQLSVKDSQHLATVEKNLLSIKIELDTAAGSQHISTSDLVGLGVLGDTDVFDATHVHTSDKATLERVQITTAKNSTHQFVSDFAGLVSKGDIDVFRSSGEHTTGNASLEVKQWLSPHESTHKLTSGKAVVEIIIRTFDSTHELKSDGVGMTVFDTVQPESSQHVFRSGSVSIYRTEPIVDREFVVNLTNERILSIPVATREITVT